MSPLVTAGRAASTAGGAVLAVATRSAAAVRAAAKPLHPRGEVWAGRVERRGSPERSGVPWLDGIGEDDVLVRLSRAVGLPDGWPDVHGLALRLDPGSGPADLLLASTGWGALTRFTLTVSRRPEARPLTTLLPYRTETGPVLLGARSSGHRVYELAWSRRTGPWWPFASLRLAALRPDGPRLSFDPVRNRLPGLEQYPSVVRLREPSYLTARRSRVDD